MLFTSITLGAGFKGGEIVPIFFTGATFGCVVAPLLGLAPGLGAALGMVALFCGCTNSPLASSCLAIEVFGGQNIELFALACAVSYMMSSYFSLYRSSTSSTPNCVWWACSASTANGRRPIPTRKTDFLSLYSQGKCDIINL